jgi:1-aminocyclopropane-1-carboxylate deaminase/D-cysteine desulfhydrase-like pyridoxal-dependent ACC family enzyme
VIDEADLIRRLAGLPRVELACKPTPLQFLPRLSQHLGGPRIFIKRDDLTGLAFGGNKTRQLEYVFGEVLRAGADSVVAGAYTQSNWCRQIAAAANRCGLACHLVLAHGRKGRLKQGNFLLFDLLGAEVEVINTDDEGLEPFLDAKVRDLRARGQRANKLSSFSLETQSLAALGYVEASVEIAAQERALGLRFNHVYLAGSEMTPAGLALGAELLGTAWNVVGVSPVLYRLKPDRAPDIAEIGNAAAARLGLRGRLATNMITNSLDFVGPA